MRQNCLWQGTQAIILRPQALAVLRYLVTRPGQLVTKADLHRHAWQGRHVTDTVLRGCIHAIRLALGDSAEQPQYLETVGRQGYRFLGWQAMARLRLDDETPVVGRHREIERLEERLARVMEGKRQCVMISGETGIGKTTVVDLFLTHVVGQQKVRIGRGQCVEAYGEGEPYLPLLEALGQLVRSAHREILHAVLRRYAPTWLMQLPALLTKDDLEWLPPQDQATIRARMKRELAEALEAFATDTPLVLVLEDIHWSDVATVDWLAYMAQRREPVRLLMLVTYRPAEAAVWEHPLRGMLQALRGRGVCHELQLPLLLYEDVNVYVSTRLGGEVAPELTALIYQCTEGNALFMVNVLEHFVQQGLVTYAGDQWTLYGNRRMAAASIPEAFQLLITKRLEELAAAEQQVLEVASVVGQEFAVATVAVGMQCPLEYVETICDRLAQNGCFLEAVGLEEWPDGTLSRVYRFQHALYRQVLSLRLLEMRRVQTHRRIVEKVRILPAEIALTPLYDRCPALVSPPV
jgi:predicted ATPase